LWNRYSSLIAFAVVFRVEFGDKTEVLTLATAARYGPRPVLAGVAVTTAVINLVSVSLGVAVAHACRAGRSPRWPG
jgi:putative Ca2+/H+ antiporter (TMEM165/GDT1 family)